MIIQHKNNRKKFCIPVIFVLFFIYSCVTHYKTTTENLSINKNTESFDRGRNLVFNICAGCHYNRSISKFIGNPLHEIPKFLGRVYSANLTNSTAFGVMPQYSDAELSYLLKTGIARDGRFLPYMLKPMMADEDINDIIVYLRSGDTPVAAADTSVGKTHMNIIGKLATKLSGKPAAYQKGTPKPPENDPVVYGRYLVAVIGCYHCHSKSALSLDYINPEQSKGYMAGGMRFKDPQGNKLYAYNLTPDKKTGIGNFTKEDFRKAVKEGLTPDNRKLRPPMGQFKHLTDKQADAIYSYLQTLPARHHKIKGS